MRRVAEIILTLTVIGATLSFGGVEPLTYSLMEIVIFALFLAVVIDQFRRRQIELGVPIWPVLFALLVILQIVPLPASLVRAIDPARLLPAELLSIAHRSGHAVTLSIYPHDTLLALMKFLAYLGAFVLAAYVFDSRQRKSLIVRTAIFLGLFEAAYGIVQYLTGWQKIFTYQKVYYTESGTGTFINHNHFAGFLELTFPFTLAMVFYYFQIWRDAKRRGPAKVDPATASSAGMQVLVFAFLVLVSVVGVIFSRSRTGIFATLITLVFVGLFAQLKVRRKAWALGLAAFVLVAVGYGLWIGLNPVVSRFEALRGGAPTLEREGRLPTWQATLEIVRGHPLTGTGLGTFRYQFPHFQTVQLSLFFTHAHNDYLEFLSETGWVGALLLFVPILVLLVWMGHSFLTDPRRYRPAITLGCMGSTLAILIHSVADFNLHIPANALVFAIVLGIGYKAACIERRSERAKAEAGHPAVVGRVARRQVS
ncbi:MAG: O-antigen ligase family protein [Terriglobia bacterium]